MEQPPVDSIQPQQPQTPAGTPSVPDVARKRMKRLLIVFVGIPYVLYVFGAIFLMAVLPNASGAFKELIMPGVLVSILFAILLVLFAVLGVRRTLRAQDVEDQQRLSGLLRTAGIALPGIILAVITPIKIAGEPPLGIAIVEPTTQAEFVAPVAVTFSAEHATTILRGRGLGVVKYSWDFDGDGQVNEETVIPEATAVYDNLGSYPVTLTMHLDGGGTRKLIRRLSIPTAVFSVSPLRPVVDEAVRFSVDHLIDTEEDEELTVEEVQWDFDGDGEVDEVVTDSMSVVHTFLRTGEYEVSALMKLSNQTQVPLSRKVTISTPKAPAFEVTLVSEPQTLISPAPFGTVFMVETEEPIREIVWDFGDGTPQERGERVAHSFQSEGRFRVSASVRSEAGEIVELSDVVRVVERLKLDDLRFDGTPQFGESVITGSVPVTIDVTPKTTVPLVEFMWEAPDATVVGSTETRLQAIYRREGTYNIVLFAQDAEGRADRINYVLEVTPPGSRVIIMTDKDGGTAPLEIQFDASETVILDDEISGFEWLFGDEPKDAIPLRSGARINHTYEKPGTYEVQLTAFTTGGDSFVGTKTIVVRAPVLNACFTPSRTRGKAPLGVTFSLQCATPVDIVNAAESIEWDFGDGWQSLEKKDPQVHVFEEAGVYSVELTIKDAIGTVDTYSIPITVE